MEKETAYEMFVGRMVDSEKVGVALQEAVACYQLGQLQESEKACQNILRMDSEHAVASHLLGLICHRAGKKDEALDWLLKSIQCDPENPVYYNNYGTVLKGQGDLDTAKACFEKALALDPDFSEGCNNLGVVLKEKGRAEEAIAYFEKAVSLDPDFGEALNNWVNQLQLTCRWQDLDEAMEKLDRLTKKVLEGGRGTAEDPLVSLSRTSSLSHNLAVARSWSSRIANDAVKQKVQFAFEHKKGASQKITVGYLSNNFHNHPVVHLMGDVFGEHDRKGFNIFCYSYGLDDGSHFRKRIQQHCDRFVDLRNLSDRDAAGRIWDDGVDILVDLTGFTEDNRAGICALRPSPIQVSYLGFLGTTGADFFDYIVTDRIVTPGDHQPFYSEKFVYMPHCFQVNDRVPLTAGSGGDVGLPKDCFVFCSFNGLYKVEPIMFGLWMDILKDVPQSVLWLPWGNGEARSNLAREAEFRGVAADRIVFAERVLREEHLARLRHADLALDTRIYNGGATTSAALWAGVPVVTLQGSHFVSRMASSLLTAVGLPELIAHDMEQYRELAVNLARNPQALQSLRQKLAENLVTEPLFDTPRFVRNFEKAFEAMWEIFVAGKSPRQIHVTED